MTNKDFYSSLRGHAWRLRRRLQAIQQAGGSCAATWEPEWRGPHHPSPASAPRLRDDPAGLVRTCGKAEVSVMPVTPLGLLIEFVWVLSGFETLLDAYSGLGRGRVQVPPTERQH